MNTGGTSSRPLFTKREQKILTVLARTIIPPGGGITLGADDIQMVDRLADYLRRFPWFFRIGYRLLLHLVNLAALPFTLRTFLHLPPDRQTRFLEKWEANRIHPWRQIFLFAKMLILLIFYSEPRVQQELGYQPECTTGRRPGT